MVRRAVDESPPSQYFPDDSEESDLQFIHSGCTLLDCVLGGGYPLGRVVNIVGDKSTGKTLLAMEASANFLLQFPRGQVRYLEAEAAFDDSYARSLGIPIGKRMAVIEDILTVEKWCEDLETMLEAHIKSKQPGLYIVDSLDALSDEAEQGRDLEKGTYGGDKAKQMGKIFRRVVRQLKDTQVCLIIISQVRDKIGVMFGERYSRSGGKAMDFYASQAVWLSHLKTLTKQKSKVDRAVGVRIKAKCKKNKVGLPFRECEFSILFHYGVDDEEANREWLLSVKREDLISQDKVVMAANVVKAWKDIDHEFRPPTRKYT